MNERNIRKKKIQCVDSWAEVTSSSSCWTVKKEKKNWAAHCWEDFFLLFFFTHWKWFSKRQTSVLVWICEESKHFCASWWTEVWKFLSFATLDEIGIINLFIFIAYSWKTNFFLFYLIFSVVVSSDEKFQGEWK